MATSESSDRLTLSLRRLYSFFVLLLLLLVVAAHQQVDASSSSRRMSTSAAAAAAAVDTQLQESTTARLHHQRIHHHRHNNKPIGKGTRSPKAKGIYHFLFIILHISKSIQCFSFRRSAGDDRTTTAAAAAAAAGVEEKRVKKRSKWPHHQQSTTTLLTQSQQQQQQQQSTPYFNKDGSFLKRIVTEVIAERDAQIAAALFEVAKNQPHLQMMVQTVFNHSLSLSLSVVCYSVRWCLVAQTLS